MLKIEEIMERIPHRYPFLLVDRVLEMEEKKSIKAIKNVTFNEEFFQGHFPGHPVMPGVLIVEGMAQALGVLVMNKDEDKVPYFMSINNAKFRKPVKPGDQLEYHLEITKLKSKIMKAKGKAYVDGKVAAQAELMFSIVDK
ncbi:MAG: 3-hydroxyacyl-ACP dehydratase FabZ [Fusobacteriota bacterium]